MEGVLHCLRAPPTRGSPRLIQFLIFFRQKKKLRNLETVSALKMLLQIKKLQPVLQTISI